MRAKQRRATSRIGERYGRLVVNEIVRRDPRGTVHVRTTCDCGTSSVAILGNIVSGLTRSCGCRRDLAMREANTTHGASHTRLYLAWRNMRLRCENPRHPSFRLYGGRGITVCERWRESFENFRADMGEKPSPAHSIDRINNDAGYSPSNCRWATQSEQMRNTSRTTFIVLDGKRVPAISACETHGVSRQLFGMRTRAGWDPAVAATRPPKKPRAAVTSSHAPSLRPTQPERECA